MACAALIMLAWPTIARAETPSDLVGRAQIQTWDRHPGCVPGATHPPNPRWAEGEVGPEWLERIALLRRPQTAEERAVSTLALRPWFGAPAEPFIGATRIATAANGSRFVLTVGRTDQQRFAMSPSYERCTAWRRDRVRKLVAGRPRGFRRRALRADAEIARQSRPRPLPPLTLTIALPDPRFSIGSALGPRAFTREGLFTFDDVDRSFWFFGLVPDGVATVIARFPAKRVAVERVLPVRDNVVAIRAPRRTGTFPDRIVWRGVDGAILHVIKPKIFYADFERP